MDIFRKIAEKRREIEEATKTNIAKSFVENLNEDTEIKNVEKSFDNELNEVRENLFDDITE